MVNEKYYTPSIEEFHVGFEFEFETGIKGWQPFIFKQDKSNQVFSNFEDFPIHFRVKYLDKEDIESLGWELKKLDFYTKQVEIGFNSGTNWFIRKVNDNKYTISYELYSSWGNGNGAMEFVINNKSELKKLMGQLLIK